jgi:hypothetical protein
MVLVSDDNFYTTVIEKSPLFHSVDRVSSLDLLEPKTMEAVLAILADAKALGMPLMVFETYRSVERQLILFNQHATQLKQVGVHHYGLACDIVKDINGEPSWKGDFSLLGTLSRKHGLVWGGNWNEPGPYTFVDMDHVQRCSLMDQFKLFAGTWYPDNNYDPLAGEG